MKDREPCNQTTEWPKAPPTFATNGKIYSVCSDCGKIIRINKPLAGSWHFCTTPDERRANRAQINRETLLACQMLQQLREKACKAT